MRKSTRIEIGLNVRHVWPWLLFCYTSFCWFLSIPHHLLLSRVHLNECGFNQDRVHNTKKKLWEQQQGKTCTRTLRTTHTEKYCKIYCLLSMISPVQKPFPNPARDHTLSKNLPEFQKKVVLFWLFQLSLLTLIALKTCYIY